ncbi:MAG: phosphonate utilization associated transcriptional regulator [Comamonadaceae bacterium]|nr:phosphonate utilization associated transcriptional regulator [Comamonadaceae bacterium]
MNAPLHPTITLLQTNSLASAVQQAIEQAILSGQYSPGVKLIEAALAEKLGVSRGPIREAFRMLDEAGLVRTEKNRGVFVRDISLDEATEIFDLRAAMEEMVGRQLARQITPAELQEVNTLLDAMTHAVSQKNIDVYYQLNLQFHDRLVELTGNRRLLAIYRKLIKELTLFRQLNLRDAGVLPLSEQGHRQIVNAIASGNAESAGRAMADHVGGSKQRMLDNKQRMASGQALASSVRPAD